MSDVQAIFDLDPLDLAKDDEALMRLIEHFRTARSQWKLGDKKAGKEKKEKTQLSLSDLGDIKI